MRNRKPKKRIIGAEVERRIVDKLDAEAGDHGISRSDMIRKIFKERYSDDQKAANG